MNEQQQISIKADELESIACPAEECRCALWDIKYELKKVPATISPHGKTTIQPIQVFFCVACGAKFEAQKPVGAYSK